MKIKSLKIFVAAACAAALLFAGAQKARSIYSSPVTVTNTSTNPALVSNIDIPGRIPYQSIVNMTGKCPPGGNTCFWEFGSPTFGHRIVIQHISGLIQPSGGTSHLAILLNNGSGSSITNFFAPIDVFSAFDQPVEAYFDPANIIEVQIETIGGSFPNPADSFSEEVTLTGYELDCNAAPCPAIAH